MFLSLLYLAAPLYSYNFSCLRRRVSEIRPIYVSPPNAIFGQPSVCKTVRPMLLGRCLSVMSVCPVCPVCDVGVLWLNGYMGQYETWHAGRPRPCPHCVRWGPSSPSPKKQSPHKFRPMSIVAKRLDGSRCHLVWRKASALATLC